MEKHDESLFKSWQNDFTPAIIAYLIYLIHMSLPQLIHFASIWVQFNYPPPHLFICRILSGGKLNNLKPDVPSFLKKESSCLGGGGVGGVSGRLIPWSTLALIFLRLFSFGFIRLAGLFGSKRSALASTNTTRNSPPSSNGFVTFRGILSNSQQGDSVLMTCCNGGKMS